MDGLLNLDDFAEQTGLRLPEGPYETAAGWAMWKLGRLPVRGDVLTERPDGADGGLDRRDPRAGREAGGPAAGRTAGGAGPG